MSEGERRRAVYVYIVQYIQAHSYAPSLREIAAAVGLNSTAAVEYHLRGLVQDGLIARGRYVARGLTIVRRQSQVVSGDDERNMHFRGWAEAVLDRLIDANDYLALIYESNDRDMQQAITIVAQAAYELVKHTLHVLELDNPDIPFQDVCVPEDIPDLEVL